MSKIYKNPPILYLKVEILFRINCKFDLFLKKIDEEITFPENLTVAKNPIIANEINFTADESLVKKETIGYTYNIADDIQINYMKDRFNFIVLKKYSKFGDYLPKIKEFLKKIQEYVEKINSISVQVVNKIDLSSNDNIKDFFKIGEDVFLKHKIYKIHTKYLIQNEENKTLSTIILTDIPPENTDRSLALDISCRANNKEEISFLNLEEILNKLKKQETKLFNKIITKKTKILID